MNENFFRSCFNSYRFFNEECLRVSQECNSVKFCVLQCEPKFQNFLYLTRIIDEISDFYNENWLGNADYIHIPDSRTILENYLKYPIILAYQEINGFIDILGVATIKYFENSLGCINPYYPIIGKRYFEVTGILVKQNNNIKNIGKHIYEIVLEALKKYKNILPDFDVIFVADCRNYMSINGARGGAKYLRETVHTSIYGNIIGFYTLKRNQELVEAPTFITKFCFDDYKAGKNIIFDYKNDYPLFESLTNNLFDTLKDKGIKKKIDNLDGDGLVSFYELEEQDVNLDGVTILTNGTELGNDRTPWIRKRVRVHE